MMNEFVLLNQEHPGIAVLSLNRKEKRNALNIRLMQELIDAFAFCEKDSSKRAVILKGEGPVFSSGLDLTEVQDETLTEKSSEVLQKLYKTIYSCPLVTIAAVHGAAMAGGAGLFLACDIVFAEKKTQFGFPETKRGLVPAHISVLLSRQVNQRTLHELLLVGDMFDAVQAKSWGLVNHVASEEHLFDQALECAKNVMQRAPCATEMTKQLIRELYPAEFEIDQRKAHLVHKKARRSDEAKEGLAAFFEKREAKWQK